MRAFEEVSKQLMSYWDVFQPDIEVLMLLLVNLIHVSFETDDINIQMCENIAFCLSKVFEITRLTD
jgi:hypothetical protein